VQSLAVWLGPWNNTPSKCFKSLQWNEFHHTMNTEYLLYLYYLTLTLGKKFATK